MSFTPTARGDYWWYASYSGGPNNGGTDSVCGSGMPETVVQLMVVRESVWAGSAGVWGGGLKMKMESSLFFGRWR